MYYDLRRGEHLLHCRIACLEESRILLGFLCPLSAIVAPASVTDFAHRPQHACRGLVAHLHPSRRDAVVLQQLQHVAGVIGHILQHLLVFMPRPRGRHILLARVCPPVRVMEVHHHLHPQCLGTQCLHEQVVLVAPATVLLWVHPHTQSDGVEPHLLHQRRGLALLACIVIHFQAALLHLRAPADVGTEKEVRCLQCQRRKGQNNTQGAAAHP